MNQYADFVKKLKEDNYDFLIFHDRENLQKFVNISRDDSKMSRYIFDKYDCFVKMEMVYSSVGTLLNMILEANLETDQFSFVEYHSGIKTISAYDRDGEEDKKDENR